MMPRGSGWSVCSGRLQSCVADRTLKARCRQKDAITATRETREAIENTKTEIRAERALDPAKAAAFGRQFGGGKRLTENEASSPTQQSGRMLTEEVTEDDIADVVGKWTGIPVSRLLEGEVQKLIAMRSVSIAGSSVKTKR